MNKRRIVITGLGLVTACGKGWKRYWQSALQAQSSIRRVQGLSLNGFPFKVAGEVLNYNASEFVQHRKLLKVMSREIMLAVGAGQLAIEDAGLILDDDTRDRFGISLGTGIINNDLDEIGSGIKSSLDENGVFQISKFGQAGIRSLYPLWFLKYLPNMPACHLSIVHGLRGPSNTVTTSSAAGAHAIGEAFRIIERGDADLMLAGGTDSKLNAMGISRFHLLGLLSRRNGKPKEAYCPFDERHDGVILGEGAGLLVLEELEHAKARGALIYAELIGYGSSSDFSTDPRDCSDSSGKRLAMNRALLDSGYDPADIDFVLANGSGIPQDDGDECRAIHQVFDTSATKIPVTAFKPVAGHLNYGSAGVEMAAGCAALHEGVIPPLINLKKPAQDCELSFVKDAPMEVEAKTFLFNSFGFGGQHASLIVKKHKAH